MANKRRQLTVAEKVYIISRLHNGERNSILAKEFGISHSTISTIRRNKDKIIQCLNESSIKKKRLRSSTISDVDISLLEWFKQQRSVNIPINGPILLSKANDLAIKFGIDRTISPAWIQRFRARHNIIRTKNSFDHAVFIQGPSLSYEGVTTEPNVLQQAENIKEELIEIDEKPQICEQYNDETNLFATVKTNLDEEYDDTNEESQSTIPSVAEACQALELLQKFVCSTDILDKAYVYSNLCSLRNELNERFLQIKPNQTKITDYFK